MNKSLTMSVDENLLREAERIAIERNTTVAALIGNLLRQFIEKEDHRKSQIINDLESLFDNSQAQVGIKDWSRDELHER